LGDGLVEFALLFEYAGPCEVRTDLVRIELKRFDKMVDGFGVAVLTGEYHSKMVVKVGLVGIELETSEHVGHGLLRLAL